MAIAGNLSKGVIEEYYENSFFHLDKKITSQTKTKNELNVITRTGREEIDFNNIEFSRILLAWNIPSLKYQRINIGLEILASILSFGRNSRLVKILKEDKNLVQSIYMDVSAGELGSLLILEACCEDKNLKNVEEEINKIIKEVVSSKKPTPNELKKAINIVKSSYIYNLETSTQIASFFGNEFLWGRENSIKDLNMHLDYWRNGKNFKKILDFLSRDKFTLIASAS